MLTERVRAAERMTWEQICRAYPDEWVVLVDLEWCDGDEDSGELAAAVPLGHSKTRADCFAQTRAIRDAQGVTEFANWFTGRLLPHVQPSAS